MSWNQTYTHTLALGADRFAAAVVFNQPDITVSSLCWIVMTAESPLPPNGDIALHQAVTDAYLDLKLYIWQLHALRWIGKELERTFPGHCEAARQGDLDTSARARALLGVTA